MFSTKSFAKLLALSLAAGAATGALAASIVVRSNGPSAGQYPPGKMLDPAGTIMLKAGDSVTVLDAGGTHVLSGVGKVPVAAKGAASGAAFTALLASAGGRQARTGATRGSSDAAPRPTNVWYVDSTRAGVTCVANPAATMLWRAKFDAAQTLTITNIATAKKATLDYASGQSTRTWPADVPLVDGGSYKLEGGTAPVTVKVKLLAAAPDQLDTAAQELLAKGCQNQVDLLVASTTEH